MKRLSAILNQKFGTSPTNQIATEALDKNYLYGLNTLRFLAAFFIIAMHIQNNQKVVGLKQLPEFAFLYKGAVSFFFTLSGFLITYIRIGEYKKTGTINIKRFLSNRFARLAPLYYTVVALGLFFYWFIVPKLGLESYTEYNFGLATLLYILFLPNLINSFYHVGGALHVSWSIGVQEQFYWLLLPSMKYKMNRLPGFLIGLTILSIAVSIGNAYNVFGVSKEVQAFIHTLRFHYMTIGSLLGYYLAYHREQLLELWIFSKKWTQVLLFMTLIGWYGFKTDSIFIKNTITLPLSLLYGWIIINVGANPKNIIKLDNKIFDWLGQRTFGIYLMHMFVVYAVSFFYLKTGLFANNFVLYIISFYVLVFGIVVGLAQLSFKYFEQPIMAKHKKAQQLRKKTESLILQKIVA